MPSYYDFTVSLQDVLPRPWRRVLVRTTVTFAALHDAIQNACGWANSHLYQFLAAGPYDRDPIAALDGEPFAPGERPIPEAGRVRLARYFGAAGGVRRTSCLYWYDFGDDWTHDVQLNAVVDLPDRFARRLVGGEHAFPPDDCGGAGGYAAIQDALRTGRDPEGLLDWARGVWGGDGRVRRGGDPPAGGPLGRGRGPGRPRGSASASGEGARRGPVVRRPGRRRAGRAARGTRRRRRG